MVEIPHPQMNRGRLSRYRLGVRVLSVSPIYRLCCRPARAPRRVGRTEAAIQSTPLSSGGIDAEGGADAPILVCEREPARTPNRPHRLHRIGKLMCDPRRQFNSDIAASGVLTFGAVSLSPSSLSPSLSLFGDESEAYGIGYRVTRPPLRDAKRQNGVCGGNSARI